MKVVPIVFCFDDNLLLPAGVCLTSLLENANEDTFYDIFILHDDASDYPTSGFLEKLHKKYVRFSIKYRAVDSQFKDAYETRGINVSTYYRLLIPELIPEYDKIMYHDVDVVFREDLSAIYSGTEMDNYYVAGVVSSAGLSTLGRTKRENLGLNWKEYILAGNIIVNSEKMRDDGIVEQFKKEVMSSHYEYQDMDIINIVCRGKIRRMPPVFCGTIGIFELASQGTEQELYSRAELEEVKNKGVIHYNGPKPWNSWCPNFDIWWEYYRISVYYDHQYYFDFYYKKLHELDQWSLWKRIKLLLRYFKTFSLRK